MNEISPDIMRWERMRDEEIIKNSFTSNLPKKDISYIIPARLKNLRYVFDFI